MTSSSGKKGDLQGEQMAVGSRNLSRSTFDSLVLIAADLFSIVAWMGMLVYALLLWYNNGVLVDESTISIEALVAAATPLSTIFSILFAATFARVLRTLALWILERGGTIGLLDQLVGSLSVSSALLTQISAGLRRSITLHMAGTALIVLWLLSPLGSQAVLRIASIVPSYQVEPSTIPYFNMTFIGGLSQGGSDSMFTTATAKALLNAALASPISAKNQMQDLWGYVKIPRLSRMPVNGTDPQAWRPIEIKSVDDYSSLVGLPLSPQRFLSDRELKFSIESWYFELDCGEWVNEAQTFQVNTTYLINVNDLSIYEATKIFFNTTSANNRNTSRVADLCSLPAEGATTLADCPQLDARKIYVTLAGSGSNCDISTEHVETELTCAKGACIPSRIRQSLLPHLSRNWTIFDIGEPMPSMMGSWFIPSGAFFYNFVIATAGDSNLQSGLTGYMIDPGRPFTASSWEGTMAAPGTIKTSRYAQILNTYWMSSVGGILIAGDDSAWQNLTKTFDEQNYGFSSMDISAGPTAIADTTVMRTRRELHCSITWLLAFTVITTLALASSIAGLVLTMLTKGPRLAMNISTILRDNRYNGLGSAGSYMDDNVRSRRTQATTVRIGDVVPDQDVGHIAISTVMGEGTMLVDKLRKGRLYD